jgi:hypothetical protein
MSYRSTFDIRAKINKLPAGIKAAKLDISAIFDSLEVLETDERFVISGSDAILCGFDSEAYWYKHDEHMKQLSAMYAGVLFTVVVHGEEPGDTSCHYYYNGKSQKAEITYTPFDEALLAE